jgi:hypothetical protein
MEIYHMDRCNLLSRRLKNVTAKYGAMVNVTWMDMGTTEGMQYTQEHGLSAHLQACDLMREVLLEKLAENETLAKRMS